MVMKRSIRVEDEYDANQTSFVEYRRDIYTIRSETELRRSSRSSTCFVYTVDILAHITGVSATDGGLMVRVPSGLH